MKRQRCLLYSSLFLSFSIDPMRGLTTPCPAVKSKRVCPRLDSPEGEVKGGHGPKVRRGTHPAHYVKRQRLDMGIYRCMHCWSLC